MLTSLANATSVIDPKGNLSALVSEGDTDLRISGEMNVRDFAFINKMANLATLDLSSAQITEYDDKNTYFGDVTHYNANELPTFCFMGMPSLTSVTMPVTLTTIGEGAFAATKIATITFPESVTTIGANAFNAASAIQSVEIPNTVTEIGEYAFANCNVLKSITYSASCNIPRAAFKSCPMLSSIEITSNITEIGEDAFCNCCSLVNVGNFPLSLTVIGEAAFRNCTALENVNLSTNTNLKGISDWAFTNCLALTELQLPTSDYIEPTLEKIGNGAFFVAAENGADIVLPYSVKIIGDYAFAYDNQFSRSDYFIPFYCEKIGKYAFAGWEYTPKFVLHKNVKEIDSYAFANCTGVTEIECEAVEPPVLGDNVFQNMPQESISLLVEKDSKALYKGTDQWCEFNISDLTEVEKLVKADESVKATFDGTLLLLTASETIDRAMVFDPSGAVLADVSNGSEQVTIETADFTAKVYLLAIRLASGKSVNLKLIRK